MDGKGPFNPNGNRDSHLPVDDILNLGSAESLRHERAPAAKYDAFVWSSDDSFCSNSDISDDVEASNSSSSNGANVYISMNKMSLPQPQRPPSIPLEELSVDETLRELRRLEQGSEPCDRQQLLTWRGRLTDSYSNGLAKPSGNIVQSSSRPLLNGKAFHTARISPTTTVESFSNVGAIDGRKLPEGSRPVLSKIKSGAGSKHVENPNENQIKNCVACLRQRESMKPIFDEKNQLLDYIKGLLSYVKVQGIKYSPKIGVCSECLDQLLRWHVFMSAINERRSKLPPKKPETESPPPPPVTSVPTKERVYKDWKKLKEVKEIYSAGTHLQLCERRLFDADWEHFCDSLFHMNTVKSNKGRELAKFVTDPDRLCRLYCTLCDKLIPDGWSGFRRHKEVVHAENPVMYPCDICGILLPESETNLKFRGLFHHWIAHFYIFRCEDCPKKFPTKKSLTQHVYCVHKVRQQCDKCGKLFTSEKLLDIHMINHSPEIEDTAAEPEYLIHPDDNPLINLSARNAKSPSGENLLTMMRYQSPSPRDDSIMEFYGEDEAEFVRTMSDAKIDLAIRGHLLRHSGINHPTLSQFDVLDDFIPPDPSKTNIGFRNVDHQLKNFPDNERMNIHVEPNKDGADNVFSFSDFIEFESTIDLDKAK